MGLDLNKPDVIAQVRTPQTLVNNTALAVDITVPNDEVWLINGAAMNNADDVARRCQIMIIDTSANVFHMLAQDDVNAADILEYPNVNVDATFAKNTHPNPMFIVGGLELRFYWWAGGASTGGTGYLSYTVKKWNVGNP